MASPSSDSVPVDEIKDLLTCSLCSKTLNKPRSLSCLHNFCKECLEKYVEYFRGSEKKIETFPCPKCRSEFTLKSDKDVVEMPNNPFIESMLEILAIQGKAKASPACSHCQNPAISHCASCGMFMCEKCATWHDIWPGNKNHNVLPVGELSNRESHMKMKRKLYCGKHKEEVLKYYCETCKKLCCIDCVILNHQKPNHSCVPVSDVAQKQKETLQSSCKTLDVKFSEGKEALEIICKVMESLEKNAMSARDTIKEQKKNILKTVTEKLDEKCKKMNEEVDKVYSQLRGELSKQHDEIKEYLDKIQASVSLSRNLLKIGSIEEILSSQKMIDENIEMLRNDQPENLVAVNVGSIQFVPGDIGNVNVDGIVGKLEYVEGSVSANLHKLRKSSSILNGKIRFMIQLQKWLGEKFKWDLCYRASRDGWSAQDFHSHCDNKGPTVVLVEANDCIFGGYTDQDWEGNGDFKSSNSSFLLCLRNADSLAPFTASIKQGQEQFAIYCDSSYGPTFGAGHDLYICDNPQINQSSTNNFGHSYQLPTGYVFRSEEGKKLFAGQYQFLTTEIEVLN